MRLKRKSEIFKEDEIERHYKRTVNWERDYKRTVNWERDYKRQKLRNRLKETEIDVEILKQEGKF